MFQVITFRSEPLKNKTIFIEVDEPAATRGAGFNVAKKNKEIETGNTYLIDGEEVREEDLTENEQQDIIANKRLNQDGFYTPLEPIDAFLNTDTNMPKKKLENKKMMIIGGIILATIVILAGIILILL